MATVHDISRVFSLFSDKEIAMGVREMARRLNLSKSKVQRLASDMAQEGFLRKDERRRYRLGHRVLELGGLAQLHNDLTRAADPVLRNFVHRTNQNVHLVVRDGVEALCIYRATGSRPGLWNARIGKRAPLHASATGKVLLAFSEDAVAEDLIDRGLTKLTSRTITDGVVLRKQLADVREQGYAVSVDEAFVGQRSIACPIRYSNGVIAAIGVSLHSSYDYQENIKLLLKELSQAATQISARIE